LVEEDVVPLLRDLDLDRARERELDRRDSPDTDRPDLDLLEELTFFFEDRRDKIRNTMIATTIASTAAAIFNPKESFSLLTRCEFLDTPPPLLFLIASSPE
jgi:hypothetical protein